MNVVKAVREGLTLLADYLRPRHARSRGRAARGGDAATRLLGRPGAGAKDVGRATARPSGGSDAAVRSSRTSPTSNDLVEMAAEDAEIASELEAQLSS